MAKHTADRRPAPNATEAATGRALLELADEAGERFDEACEHARLELGGDAFRLGPALPLPIARLRPGRLAWSRELSAPEGTAQVYYVLDPPTGPRGREREELPVVDLVPAQILVDVRPAGSSPVRLLGVAGSQGAPRRLSEFVRSVADELASDRE